MDLVLLYKKKVFIVLFLGKNYQDIGVGEFFLIKDLTKNKKMSKALKITESFFYEGSIVGLRESLVRQNKKNKLLSIITSSILLSFMKEALNCEELKDVQVFEDKRIWRDGYFQIIHQLTVENIFNISWEPYNPSRFSKINKKM